jgi:FkbM family methyltransferase
MVRNKLIVPLKSFIQYIEPSLPKFLIKYIELMIKLPTKYYSFYGEDAIIQGILDKYKFDNGVDFNLSYIDIGAWRPVKGSNTYFLYKKGMNGSVVEPNPYFKKLWDSVRPRDQYLQFGCSNSPKENLQIFNASAASNTMNFEFMNKISAEQYLKISNQLEVDCLTLEEIILLHQKLTPTPFLLDIDIEGLDFEVIKAFSFEKKLRPSLIMIEEWLDQNENINSSKIFRYLESNDYLLVGKTILTSIYIDKYSKLYSVV